MERTARGWSCVPVVFVHHGCVYSDFFAFSNVTKCPTEIDSRECGCGEWSGWEKSGSTNNVLNCGYISEIIQAVLYRIVPEFNQRSSNGQFTFVRSATEIWCGVFRGFCDSSILLQWGYTVSEQVCQTECGHSAFVEALDCHGWNRLHLFAGHIPRPCTRMPKVNKCYSFSILSYWCTLPTMLS